MQGVGDEEREGQTEGAWQRTDRLISHAGAARAGSSPFRLETKLHARLSGPGEWPRHRATRRRSRCPRGGFLLRPGAALGAGDGHQGEQTCTDAGCAEFTVAPGRNLKRQAEDLTVVVTTPRSQDTEREMLPSLHPLQGTRTCDLTRRGSQAGERQSGTGLRIWPQPESHCPQLPAQEGAPCSPGPGRRRREEGGRGEERLLHPPTPPKKEMLRHFSDIGLKKTNNSR